MANAQKTYFVFRRNGGVHLNRRGHQFSWLLAAEVCASAVVMVVMLDTPCSEVVWRVLATHSIRQFPLHVRHRVPSHFNWTLPPGLTFKKFCMLITFAFMCFVWLSEQTVTFALYIITRLVLSPKWRVYCAVRTESLYNTVLSLTSWHRSFTFKF